MSAYELSRVLEKWDREELTSEQAIGQLLLLVESLNRRVGAIERRLERLRSGRLPPIRPAEKPTAAQTTAVGSTNEEAEQEANAVAAESKTGSEAAATPEQGDDPSGGPDLGGVAAGGPGLLLEMPLLV